MNNFTMFDSMLDSSMTRQLNVNACPNGMVIPDDPNSSGNWYPNRTLSECAISCYESPFFSAKQRKDFYLADVISLVVSVICALIVLNLWLRDSLKKKQVFVITYGAVIALTFTFRAFAFTGGPNRNCRNNANIIDGSEGLTLCAFEGACMLFSVLFCGVCFCIQSFDFFRRIVLKQPMMPDQRPFIYIIVAIPSILTIIGLANGIFGSDFTNGKCRVIDTGTVVVLTTVVPMTISVVLGLVFAFTIVVKILVLMYQHGVDFWDGVVLTGTSLQYLIFSGFYLLSLLIIRFTVTSSDSYDRDNDQIEEWAQCALLHYDGVDESSYTSVCGSHAAMRYSFAIYLFYIIWIRVGFGVFFLLVNLQGLLVLFSTYVCTFSVRPHPSAVSQSAVQLGTSSLENSLSFVKSIGESGLEMEERFMARKRDENFQAELEAGERNRNRESERNVRDNSNNNNNSNNNDSSTRSGGGVDSSSTRTINLASILTNFLLLPFGIQTDERVSASDTDSGGGSGSGGGASAENSRSRSHSRSNSHSRFQSISHMDSNELADYSEQFMGRARDGCDDHIVETNRFEIEVTNL